MTQPAGTLSLFATLRRDADRSAHGPREHGGLADVQLVALAREDRAAAIEVMYSAHKGRIYTFLLRFLADAEMADDVTQDTFAKAFSALGSLTPSHRVLPWLYRIATNTALDHLRRRRRFAWIRMGAIANTADEPPMPDEHARVPEREHIQAVLRGLPPENAIALRRVRPAATTPLTSSRVRSSLCSRARPDPSRSSS